MSSESEWYSIQYLFQNKMTSLIYASNCGKLEVVETLLKNNANVEAKNVVDMLCDEC